MALNYIYSIDIVCSELQFSMLSFWNYVFYQLTAYQDLCSTEKSLFYYAFKSIVVSFENELIICLGPSPTPPKRHRNLGVET